MATKKTKPGTSNPRTSPNARQPLSIATDVATGVVDLLKSTMVTALAGVREVGAEVGSVAVTAVRGSIRAAGEIGGDVGRLATDAAAGAIEAANRIGAATGRTVEDLVTGTIEGVKEIVQGPGERRTTLARRAEEPRRTTAASRERRARAPRKPLARRSSRAGRAEAQPSGVRTAAGAA